MELYEIESQAIFDEPVEYNGIKIYPITVRYYKLVKAASCAFAVNIANETDLDLIGLPYMEYMMKKADKDEEYLNAWNIFNSILQLSFKDQIHSFKYENNFLKLVVAVPTEKYNEETMCVYREKLSEYRKLAKDSFHVAINENQLKKLKKDLDIMAEEMFVIKIFNDNEFEDIKKIICYLNDIDDSIIDPKWEVELKKASETMAKINASKNPPTFEDLIDCVALSLNKLPKEIENMTIRRFDRYLEMQNDKENYELCKTAELNGTEFKNPVNHWLKAYKPKGRYSGVQNNGAGMNQIFQRSDN